MTAPQKPHWTASLAFRLLLALSVIQVGFVAAELMGLTRFLGGVLEREATSEAAQLGRVIRQTARQQMLGGSVGGMQATMDDLGQIQAINRVLIIDKRGRVAHATDRQLVGRVLDRNSDAECVVCHTAKGVKPSNTSIAVDDEARAVIRHAEVIQNEPACAHCHGTEARITGVILIDQSTVAYQRAQQTVGKGIVLTGAATLGTLIVVTLFTTTMLVVRPVRRLVNVVRQMAGGDLTVRAPVRGRGELAHLSATVNGMAEDLSRSIEEIRDKTAELSIVYSILGRVTKSISMTALKNVVIETFNEIMSADRTLLISRVTEGQPVEVLSKARGADRIDRFLDEDNIGKAVRAGVPANAIGEWSKGQTFDPFVTADRLAAILPIEARPNTSLLLVVLRSKPFSEGEANAKLLRVVAGHVTAAFENSRLYSVATTDDLTRLATARHLYSGIEAQTSRNESGGAECALLMLGLDHFAAITDQGGAAVGNIVLKNVAWQVMRLIRFGDSAFRYRGEVFALLLPGCDVTTAATIAERLRTSIEATLIHSDSGHPVRIDVSVGGVVWSTQTTTPQDLVNAADAALTEARRIGRNHVMPA